MFICFFRLTNGSIGLQIRAGKNLIVKKCADIKYDIKFKEES